MNPMIVAVICGAAGLGLAGFMARYVLKQDQGSPRIREISAAIKEGALAFLGREYKILFIFVAVVAIVLGLIPMLGWWVTLAFIFGAGCSALAGYLGMNMAIRANSRTAAAAQKSLNDGLRVSFRSGAVMGLCVVGIFTRILTF
jgi:K(+)-stimulated pyrophosphate-energized sodium pump